MASALKKSTGRKSRALCKISNISPRWTTQEAESGTPRASSIIAIAVLSFSIESIVILMLLLVLSVLDEHFPEPWSKHLRQNEQAP